MSVSVKCDKCGKPIVAVIDSNNERKFPKVDIRTIGQDGFYNYRSYELCEVCLKNIEGELIK